MAAGARARDDEVGERLTRGPSPADGTGVPDASPTHHRLPRPTAWLGLLLLAVLGAALGTLPAGATPGAGDGGVVVQGPIAEGVVLTERAHPGPVRTHEVQVFPGAPTRLVPVLSGGRIDGAREVVSSMCARVGGAVCVNANFPTCPTCGQPFGGVVQDGRILRSPTWEQDQVSFVDGAPTLDPWRWSAGLWALGAGPEGTLEVDGINVGPLPDGIVLHTPDHGPSTRAPAGAYELVVRAPQPVRTGVGQRQQAELLGVSTGGDTPIPRDGVVLSGLGAGADRLWSWTERHRSSLVELVASTSVPVTQSFAGHPVLLRDGVRQRLDGADGKVARRHPRTLLGWDDAGSIWLVVVDGRQASSQGMTLAHAVDHLLALGARHAVNLDGGGSSTLVTSCPSATGWCTRNRPSDGAERPVWVALALLPTGSAPAPEAPEGAAGGVADVGPAAPATPSAPAEPPTAADAEGGPDPAVDPPPTTAPPTTVASTVPAPPPAPAAEPAAPREHVAVPGPDPGDVASRPVPAPSGGLPLLPAVPAASAVVAAWVVLARLVWSRRRW